MLGLATQEVMKLPGLDLQFVIGMLLQFFVASLRIGAFLLSAPVFGARWLPLQVRVVMGFSLAVAIALRTPPVDVSLLASSAGIAMMFIEVAIGLTAGLTLTIWFASMLLAGEKIAATAGLGYAAQVDPSTGGQTPVVNQILYLFLLVIFMSVDGHLLAIATMMESYTILPIGAQVAPEALVASGITAAGSVSCCNGYHAANFDGASDDQRHDWHYHPLPAPQLNLFSFGFPISLLAVFIVMYFSAGAFGASSKSLIEAALAALQTLIGGLAYG